VAAAFGGNARTLFPWLTSYTNGRPNALQAIPMQLVQPIASLKRPPALPPLIADFFFLPSNA
jgi:hypothetical protein